MLDYFPENVSNVGLEHDSLFALIYWICVGIFFLVNIVLVYFLFKYRRKKGVKAYYFHGNNLVEFTWTLLPTLLFAGLGFYSDDLWTRMKYQDRVPQADVEIDVLGQQFLWHIRYPGPDGVFGRRIAAERSAVNPFGIDPNDPNGRDDLIVQNHFNLPINKMIVVHLSSVDVLHSFFLPNFRIKNDAVPGLWFDVWFDCFKAGKYELACAEICGSGHYAMRGTVTMQSEEEYNAWLNEKYQAKLAELNPPEPEPVPPAGDEAAEEVTSGEAVSGDAAANADSEDTQQ